MTHKAAPFISPATDEYWMRLALAEADAAAAHGDVPVGCVVVGSDGRMLGCGHNLREKNGDPTAHAEVVALRAAAIRFGGWRLQQATAYITLEPCVMCAGALLCARVSRIVYAASDPKAGAIDSLYRIGQDNRLNHEFVVDGGLFHQEALQRLRDFFSALRTDG